MFDVARTRSFPVIDGCLERANRSSLYSLRPDIVWCYMLDASHPEIHARYGSCEDYYVPSYTFPGVHWLCKEVMTPRGVKCTAECVFRDLETDRAHCPLAACSLGPPLAHAIFS